MKDEERAQILEKTQSGKQHYREDQNSVSPNIALGSLASKSQGETLKYTIFEFYCKLDGSEFGGGVSDYLLRF